MKQLEKEQPCPESSEGHALLFDGWRYATGAPGWTAICEHCGGVGVVWQKERPSPIDRARFAVVCRKFDIDYR